MKGVCTARVEAADRTAWITSSLQVREDMLIEAAKAVARDVPDEDRAAGVLLPPVAALRDVAGVRPAWPVAATGPPALRGRTLQLTEVVAPPARWLGPASMAWPCVAPLVCRVCTLQRMPAWACSRPCTPLLAPA